MLQWREILLARQSRGSLGAGTAKGHTFNGPKGNAMRQHCCSLVCFVRRVLPEGSYWACPKWKPIPYIIHYFWPEPVHRVNLKNVKKIKCGTFWCSYLTNSYWICFVSQTQSSGVLEWIRYCLYDHKIHIVYLVKMYEEKNTSLSKNNRKIVNTSHIWHWF